MARVAHKKIKQLIAQKKKTVTDRQLFTSRAMAAHFEDMAAAQTRRYGYRRRVKVKLVWKPKDPASAKTDNNRIWLNAGHASVTQCKTRQERYEQVCGMFAHELGHVLYTDFLTSQTYHRRLEAGKWYPEPPPLHSSAERFADPISSTAPPSSDGPTAKSRAATAKLAAESAEEEASKEESPSEDSSSSAEAAEQEETPDTETAPVVEEAGESQENIPLSEPGGQSDEELPSGFHQSVSETETGRMDLENTDAVSAPEGGGIEEDEEHTGTGYSGAASDIARVLETMAENSVCAELERQRTKELTELAQSISYGNIHDGVSMTVHRMAEVPDELVEQYQEISGDLLHISKQLQKSVLQQLKDSRRGGQQTGLLMGRMLDSHTLYRRDGRVFCNNALPNDAPALSVGLLLDESGSMCSCDRATYARATAIILYDFCQVLGIPVMVYGHTANDGVDLYSYAEFDAIDRKDRYRLMDISARANNRDGAALRYVAERLAKRPEEIKLLMLVSDGQPADDGYYGTAAEEDLRGVRQEYQRRGILLVAAAIGSDKENIQRIYGDSFLDITDLNKLPVKLAGIIKRFIRV